MGRPEHRRHRGDGDHTPENNTEGEHDAPHTPPLQDDGLAVGNEVAELGDEIARVLRPGGEAWVTAPAAWPYDSSAVEHRFGEPELRILFEDLDVLEIVPQGGMLALPFALANVGVREAVRAAGRRLRLDGPAALFFLGTNGLGLLLGALARRGPASAFLGYLDRRLPVNFLVVAVKRP